MRRRVSLGIISSSETSPGIFKEVYTEIFVDCVVQQVSTRENDEDKINTDFTTSSSYSLVMPESTFGIVPRIRYIKDLGERWKVTTIDTTKRPRLIIYTGGPYED